MNYSPIERAAPGLDLFAVESDTSTMCGRKPKPRSATDKEVRTYLRWLSVRARLHQFDDMSVSTRGATFGSILTPSAWDRESRSYIAAEYETGAYSVPMPGANQRQTVTMETLDDSGAVISSQSLPIEPKKCGIIWDKAVVHKAVGPVAKPAKAKRKASPPAVANSTTPPAVEKSEDMPAVEITDAPVSSPVEMQEPVEAVIAHDEPEIAPSEPKNAPVAASDAMAAMMARLDALEAAVATMTAEDAHRNDGTPIASPWKGARQLAELRKSEADDKRQAERGRRERIVRAYLRMRARRDLDARALEAGREYCGKLQERAERAEQRERGLMMEAERLAFEVSELQATVAKETARADAAETVALPAIDKAQARIGQLEQMLAQATARGFTPKSRIAECFRATPRPVEQAKVTSNVIIMSGRG